MKQKIALVAVAVLGASSVRSQANTISTVLSEWNVVTSGNLQNVSDINGNVYVGGNYTVGNSSTVGGNDHNAATPGNVGLAVAGNISSGGINLNSGNVVVGGTISGGLNNNSHGTITTGNPSALPASPVSTIANASSYWGGLAANSSASVANNLITFNCSANSSVAIFNLSASTLFAQNQNLALATATGTKQVIINVSGASATEQNSENFQSTFQNDPNVVFNFYQATSVNFDGSSIYGYVIAPNATVDAGSPIVGGLAAADLNTTSEVELPSTTPDYSNLPDVPGVADGGTTLALLGLSFTGVAVIRRKYSLI